jgi:hypothetical protein
MEAVFLAIPIGMALSAPLIKKMKKVWLKKRIKKNIKKFNKKIELYKQFLKINELPKNELIDTLDERVRAITSSEFGNTENKHTAILKLLKRLNEVEEQCQNAFKRKKDKELIRRERDLLKQIKNRNDINECKTTHITEIKREIQFIQQEKTFINNERDEIINNYRNIYSF